MSAVPSSSTRKPIDTTLSVAAAASVARSDLDDVAGGSCPRPRRAGPRRRACAGTLKPQMSASRTPTVRPRAASAAARFTVTDDLPTPPLPLATASTRVVADTSVGAASSRAFQRARCHGRRLLLLGHLAVVDVDRRRRRGGRGPSTRPPGLIWWRSGQPAVVSATLHRDVRRRARRGRRRPCPSSTMLSVQLGVDDAREHAGARRPATARGRPRARGRARRGRWGRDVHASCRRCRSSGCIPKKQCPS